MDERADSVMPPCEEPAYRKRRRSYSAAISEENSLDEDDDDKEPEGEDSYPHRDGATRARCCRQCECIARKISSVESETRSSTESFISKRALTRESSGDIAKSWSEIELPEILLAHPEILSRMMRCRCFLAQFSACQCRCRCVQCQYQRRKISSTSSCFARDSVQGVGARRKDSGNSVSTCQSFLPPSSGRNSAGSLYHCCVDIGDNGTTIQRRHSIAAGLISHHRYSDQTHSRGWKIRADNRRLSEQPLVDDTIENCEGTTGAANAVEPITSNTRPRTFLKTTARAAQSVTPFYSENSASVAIKDLKNSESRIANESNNTHLAASGKNTNANANAFTGRKNSAIPITPKMMKRRFSEQLILEGGLGSVGESENLFEQLENVEEAEESFAAINARKKITLNKHYYPEGGWGYVIIIITILVHLISHGLQLASGLLMSPAMTRFEQTVENSGTTYRTLLTCLTIDLHANTYVS